MLLDRLTRPLAPQDRVPGQLSRKRGWPACPTSTQNPALQSNRPLGVRNMARAFLLKRSGRRLVTRLEWNKAMHAEHGNSGWRLASLNCSGIRSPGRWALLEEIAADVVCLTETYASPLQQKARMSSNTSWDTFFGGPVNTYAGVGLMIS
eukprot:1214324-Amphidinium_carterae.1